MEHDVRHNVTLKYMNGIEYGNTGIEDKELPEQGILCSYCFKLEKLYQNEAARVRSPAPKNCSFSAYTKEILSCISA